MLARGRVALHCAARELELALQTRRVLFLVGLGAVRADRAEGPAAVEHAADILPAVDQAIASDKPFIIDAVVSSGELTMPPHISVQEGYGFGISKVKEALLGLKGDHDVWRQWRDEFRANVF